MSMTAEEAVNSFDPSYGYEEWCDQDTDEGE